MKMTTTQNSITALLLALLFVTPALAQTTTPQNETGGESEQPRALLECAVRYKTNAVPVVINAETATTEKGETVTFSGTVTNENNFVIADVAIYAKVFRDRSGGVKDVNGPDVVDWFKASDVGALTPGEVANVSFTWTIPENAQSGRYTLGTYVVADDRFDLQGLSYADDAVGNITNFAVTGEDDGAVFFDKTTVTVTDRPFYFATFPPTVLASSSVAIGAEVINSTPTTYNGTVAWKLYAWDGVSAARLIKESSDELTLPAAAKAAITYTVEDTAYSVYFLEGRVISEGGAQSLIGVRFLRNGVNVPRLYTLGADGPLTGGENGVFVCAQNAGNQLAENVELTITATPLGIRSLLGSIAEATYRGVLPSSPKILGARAEKDASAYRVTATLSQNGNVIDRVSATYTCDELETSCSLLDTWYPLYAFIALVGLILIGVITIRRRKKKLISSI